MPNYATLDRNGTEDEITIFTPEGRRMLCVSFWDEPDIASAAQLKADAEMNVTALNKRKILVDNAKGCAGCECGDSFTCDTNCAGFTFATRRRTSHIGVR